MSALQALLVFVVGTIAVLILFLLAPVSRSRRDLILLGGGLGLLGLILLTGVLLPRPGYEANAAFVPPAATDDAQVGPTEEPPVATAELPPEPTPELPTETVEPTDVAATVAPTDEPTEVAATEVPTSTPTEAVATEVPTIEPTALPTTVSPTVEPTATTVPASPTRVATSTPAATPPPTATTGPTSRPAAIISTVRSRVANIRGAPRDDGQVIGLVNNGDELVFVGVSGDWYLVRLGQDTASDSYITGGEGWVNQIVVNPPPRQPPTVSP